MSLDSLDIKNIKGVGDKRAELFSKLLTAPTVGALLRYYPRTYEDWSSSVTLEDTNPFELPTVQAVVTSDISVRFVRKGLTIYSATACDSNGVNFKLTFFNNPYIKSLLYKGRTYLFKGKINFSFRTPEMTSPKFRRADEADTLEPIYRQTAQLSSKTIAQTVARALDMMNDESFPDPIPPELLSAHGLCSAQEAVRGIHRPKNSMHLKKCRDRLVYEELLILQLALFRLKGRNRKQTALHLEKDCSDEFFSLLPFAPTNAQRRAVKDAVRDMMQGECPMSRLLQGDVGSGKTAVAAALCYCTAKNGMQSALMAPTEILAEQHYRSLAELLEPAGIRVRLLTGSLKASEKRRIYDELVTGLCDLVIGTHALISDKVEFKKLTLVITDEQHRFGVKQRAALSEKGNNPHMFVMSATPIPRTLALIVYGDLDVSVLDELPAGRQKVDTYWIDSGKRERAFNFVKKHLDEGRQAYIVCPLVDESEDEATDLASAVAYAHQLREGAFRGYSVGLLHGKLSGAEKDEVMRDFAEGKIQLLVATTVVEVGVNVPNAVLMVIENAERFGLSQLHQLRGRVGRGKYKSHCILISDFKNEEAVARFNIMKSTNDGFVIASEDLKQRGPGEFFGQRQSGLAGDAKLADLAIDTRMFAIAQADALKISESDPNLESPDHAALKVRVEAMIGESVTY